MDVVGNDRQGALHSFPADVQQIVLLLAGRSTMVHEARESMAVDEHLDEVFELASASRTFHTKISTYTMQPLRLSNTDRIARVGRVVIVLPVLGQYPLPLLDQRLLFPQ